MNICCGGSGFTMKSGSGGNGGMGANAAVRAASKDGTKSALAVDPIAGTVDAAIPPASTGNPLFTVGTGGIGVCRGIERTGGAGV